jgi:hypothetical protein
MTRVNDRFVTNHLIDCRPPENNYCDTLITKKANQTNYRAKFYENIALDIVNETVFDYPYPCITEKTLRPIACKRMFAILGPSKILRLLKSFGFQTWDDIIDESYDNLQDPQTRFLSFVNSVDEFCKIPLESVREFLFARQDRLNHNYNVLQNLRAKEINHISKLLEGLN